jgi:hypothetical protein
MVRRPPEWPQPYPCSKGRYVMSLRIVALLNVLVGLVFAVALLAAPAFLLSTYALSTNDVGLLLARLLGAEFLALNVLCLLALRQLGNPAVRRAVVIGRILSEGTGGVVALLAKVAGMGNEMVWSIPALYLAFALLYAYFLVRLPRDTKA